MERHDLLHEFPEYQEKIHQMKVEDDHFRELFDEYDELEHEVHRHPSRPVAHRRW